MFWDKVIKLKYRKLNYISYFEDTSVTLRERLVDSIIVNGPKIICFFHKSGINLVFILQFGYVSQSWPPISNLFNFDFLIFFRI